MASEDKDQTCGAILLPGIPVLPHNAIPLHIFEPRYRRMLVDAIERDGQFIIGSLPLNEHGEISDTPMNKAVLVEVVVNQALPDGRSVLIVSALHTIKILQWEHSTNPVVYPPTEGTSEHGVDQSMAYPCAIYEEVTREVPENAETIKSLLKDSFTSLLDNLSEDDRTYLLNHLAKKHSLGEVIDVIAQHTISDEVTRRFLLEERCDSKRASELLLLLEEM